jgi:hypothetical protein
MTDRIILKPTKEEAREIIWDDHEDFIIIKEEVIGKRRWSVYYQTIVKRKSDGLFFATSYSVGATEQQDEMPFEYSEPEFIQVFKTTKTVTVYE